ncbi:MAG: hypothetical protein QM784_22930 [Polyangiaceae bacterium]
MGGWLGVGYGVTYRGVEGLAMGPRLTLGLEVTTPRIWAYGLLLEGRLVEPSRFERSTLSIQTSGARTVLAAFVESRIGREISLLFEIGAGLDINHYVPLSSTSDAMAPSRGDTDYQPFVTPALRVFATGVVDFGFGVHLDVLPATTRYLTASDEGATHVVGKPRHVQPGLDLVLRWPGHVSVTR